MCGLATAFAQLGKPELLKYMLDIGAEVDEKSSTGGSSVQRVVGMWRYAV